MVDEDRVRRLLRGIETDVQFLGRYVDRPAAEVLADEALLRGIKYALITAVEGCTRVAHHIAVAQGWPVAETNADAIRQLGREGVLTPELAGSIAQAVGLRNLLVHQYGDIDDRRTVGYLARLSDLRDFTTAVARWMVSTG